MDDERSVAVLRDIAAGFDTHDLDRIMEHFAEDAVFESPRGPDRWGQRFVGRDAVRKAFAGRFAGIPDVRYTDDDHFVADDRGASEWTLSGTTVDGQRIEQARDELRRALYHLREYLRDHEYLVGREFTLADAAFAPRIMVLGRLGIELEPALANVQGWIDRVRVRPSVRSLNL